MKFPLTVSTLLLLTLNYGCVQKVQKEVQLEIKNVQSSPGNALYSIDGTTNLPESSRITVQAVRYLYPTEGQAQTLVSSNVDTQRSILARQIVEVKQGKWEANLNLWQVAPDGSFQEVWQANQGQVGLVPDNRVKFVAIFDPAGQPKQSEESTSAQNQTENEQLEGKLIRFTSEGEKYVQTSQTLSIPLPTGKTLAPRLQASELNGGWGNRYQTLPKPAVYQASAKPSAKFRQTNATLAPSEFLR